MAAPEVDAGHGKRTSYVEVPRDEGRAPLRVVEYLNRPQSERHVALRFKVGAEGFDKRLNGVSTVVGTVSAYPFVVRTQLAGTATGPLALSRSVSSGDWVLHATSPSPDSLVLFGEPLPPGAVAVHCPAKPAPSRHSAREGSTSLARPQEEALARRRALSQMSIGEVLAKSDTLVCSEFGEISAGVPVTDDKGVAILEGHLDEFKMSGAKKYAAEYAASLMNAAKEGGQNPSLWVGVHDETGEAVGARDLDRAAADALIESGSVDWLDNIVPGVRATVNVLAVVVPEMSEGAVRLRFSSDKARSYAVSAFGGRCKEVDHERDDADDTTDGEFVLFVDVRVWNAVRDGDVDGDRPHRANFYKVLDAMKKDKPKGKGPQPSVEEKEIGSCVVDDNVDVVGQDVVQVEDVRERFVVRVEFNATAYAGAYSHRSDLRKICRQLHEDKTCRGMNVADVWFRLHAHWEKWRADERQFLSGVAGEFPAYVSLLFDKDYAVQHGDSGDGVMAEAAAKAELALLFNTTRAARHARTVAFDTVERLPDDASIAGFPECVPLGSLCKPSIVVVALGSVHALPVFFGAAVKLQNVRIGVLLTAEAAARASLQKLRELWTQGAAQSRVVFMSRESLVPRLGSASTESPTGPKSATERVAEPRTVFFDTPMVFGAEAADYLRGLAGRWHARADGADAAGTDTAPCPWAVVADSSFVTRTSQSKQLQQTVKRAIPTDPAVRRVVVVQRVTGSGGTTAIRVCAHRLDHKGRALALWAVQLPRTADDVERLDAELAAMAARAATYYKSRLVVFVDCPANALSAHRVEQLDEALVRLAATKELRVALVTLVRSQHEQHRHVSAKRAASTEIFELSPFVVLEDIRPLCTALGTGVQHDNDADGTKHKKMLDALEAAANATARTEVPATSMNRFILIYLLTARNGEYVPAKKYVCEAYRKLVDGKARKQAEAAARLARCWAFVSAFAKQNATRFVGRWRIRAYLQFGTRSMMVQPVGVARAEEALVSNLLWERRVIDARRSVEIVAAHPLFARLLVRHVVGAGSDAMWSFRVARHLMVGTLETVAALWQETVATLAELDLRAPPETTAGAASEITVPFAVLRGPPNTLGRHVSPLAHLFVQANVEVTDEDFVRLARMLVNVRDEAISSHANVFLAVMCRRRAAAVFRMAAAVGTNHSRSSCWRAWSLPGARSATPATTASSRGELWPSRSGAPGGTARRRRRGGGAVTRLA